MGASNSANRGPEERGCFYRAPRPMSKVEVERGPAKENMRTETPAKAITPTARKTKKTPLAPLNNRVPLREKYGKPNIPQKSTKPSMLKTYKFEWTGEARTVAVAGSFSGWSPVSLERTDGNTFEAELELKPKRYEYKFVIDGVWQHDLHAPLTDSGMGSFNNVLEPRAMSPVA